MFTRVLSLSAALVLSIGSARADDAKPPVDETVEAAQTCIAGYLKGIEGAQAGRVTAHTGDGIATTFPNHVFLSVTSPQFPDSPTKFEDWVGEIASLLIAVEIGDNAAGVHAEGATQPDEVPDRVRTAALSFAKAREFPADQIKHLQSSPDSVAIQGRRTTYHWKSDEKGKEWFIWVTESEEGTITTEGRSFAGKPTKQSVIAREAAEKLAKDRNFPADQIKAIGGPPLTESVYFSKSDGKNFTDYKWLGNGKGGWYVRVRVANDSDKVLSVDGGYSPD